MQFISFWARATSQQSRAQRELFRQSGHRVCLHLALQTNKPGKWGNREDYRGSRGSRGYQLRRTFASATLTQQRDARPGRDAPAEGSAAGCASEGSVCAMPSGRVVCTALEGSI